ncbi:MAG: TdeIII family type II restriction endonuclease [Ignavibacteriales bacterium]|nr:TdeIII family type II restriction endonuclease [Ignavibacteriales bacterium]
MESLKKERISLEVIKTLKSRFDNFPEDASDNRNAPFHEAFLEAFRVKIERNVTDIPIFISLASWMHGLNTSLGESFFEHVAHILCDGEKRKFNRMMIDQGQQSTISNIMASLKNNTRIPNLATENNEIFSAPNTTLVEAPNFSADVYYEEENRLVLIELKTVKPNSDIFKEQKSKFLNGKAALKNRFPAKEILFYLGFPFDPLHHEKCGFDKERFFDYSIDFRKYFATEEVLLADELWNFLSQEEGTMEELLSIINIIATPNFMDKFNFINEPANIDADQERYKNILEDWFLYRDLTVINNYDNIRRYSEGHRNVQRLLSQNLFDLNNKYKENRIITLLEAINPLRAETNE